jgi:curved DNA-binding protein CbpA
LNLRFKKAAAAYEILKDSKERTRYDRALHDQESSQNPTPEQQEAYKQEKKYYKKKEKEAEDKVKNKAYWEKYFFSIKKEIEKITGESTRNTAGVICNPIKSPSFLLIPFLKGLPTSATLPMPFDSREFAMKRAAMPSTSRVLPMCSV